MNGKQNRTYRICFLVEPQERDTLVAEAEAQGVTVDDILMAPWRGSESEAEKEAELEFVKEELSSPPTPEDTFAEQERRDKIDKLLSCLTPMQERVLKLRFGIGNGGVHHTLEDIASLEGVTRERIRQIEARGMRGLKETLKKTLD